MYSLKVILLDGCPYCIELKSILYNSFSHLEIECINVSFEDKDTFKTDKIHTFPQVYFINKETQEYLIGGLDNFNDIITISNMKNIKTIKKSLKKKLLDWPSRIKLKLILLLKKT